MSIWHEGNISEPEVKRQCKTTSSNNEGIEGNKLWSKVGILSVLYNLILQSGLTTSLTLSNMRM